MSWKQIAAIVVAGLILSVVSVALGLGTGPAPTEESRIVMFAPSQTPTETPSLPPTLSATPTVDPASSTPTDTLTPTATETAAPTGTYLPASATAAQTIPPGPPATVTLSASVADLGILTPVYAMLPPAPDTVNGLPISSIVVMPDGVRQHIREIYACGLTQGINPHAFSKVGDCNSESPHYLTRFDGGRYNLGPYGYLQSVIAQFAGSYGREGAAVHRGFHAWSMFDPMWADKHQCQPGETVIACEFRLNRPSVILIRLGSNDTGSADYYEKSIRRLVEYAISRGVIPVIGTKADRLDGPDNTLNNILRRIAAEYRVPLWDFDAVAGTLPGRGLEADGVHMTTFFAHDYTQPIALQRGHGVQNLTALMMLDAVWREAMQGPVVACVSR